MVNFLCNVLRKQHGDTSVAADGHLHEASESEITTDDEDFGVSFQNGDLKMR